MLFKKPLVKPDPEKEQALRNEIEENGGLEKKDLPAMIIAALLVILPVILVLLLLFVLAAWLFVKG